MCDRVRIDPMVTVEIGNCPGLPEMFDTERLRAMPENTADPCQRQRMAIDHGNDPAIPPEWRQQTLP